MEQQDNQPKQGPWSILLDKIAFGILNWKSTLKGFLDIFMTIFGVLTAIQATNPGVHYAQWFLTSGLVAKALVAWLSSDTSKDSPPASDASPQ